MLNDCGEGACEFNESEKLELLPQSLDNSEKPLEGGEVKVPHGESCIRYVELNVGLGAVMACVAGC